MKLCCLFTSSIGYSNRITPRLPTHCSLCANRRYFNHLLASNSSYWNSDVDSTPTLVSNLILKSDPPLASIMQLPLCQSSIFPSSPILQFNLRCLSCLFNSHIGLYSCLPKVCLIVILSSNRIPARLPSYSSLCVNSRYFNLLLPCFISYRNSDVNSAHTSVCTHIFK